jgi:hypothetical protein
MNKSIVLFITICVLSFNARAQERVKEIGFSFINFDNFGLTYKAGTPTSLWRLNSIALTGNNNSAPGIYKYESKSFGFSASAGREYRQPLAQDLQFRYGFDRYYSFLSKIKVSR